MDAYLRDRAEKLGAKVINGLMMKMEQASEFAGPCIGNLGAPCCFALHVDDQLRLDHNFLLMASWLIKYSISSSCCLELWMLSELKTSWSTD
jgi:hypothetical protein